MAGVSTTGPGAIKVAPGELELNADRGPDERGELIFTNTADRPIQIGSHIHLRRRERRARVRPGGGRRIPARHRRRDVGALRAGRLAYGRDRCPEGKTVGARACRSGRRSVNRMKIDRADYAALFGPTAGDQIRLGDTDLWIEIEQDLTFGGEESVFGGGKSIRESMNQSLVTSAEGALDTVITNVVILDHWGIVRADVGISDGRIVGIGRSGNPDIADGVDPTLVIGPGTDVISGEGKILTAGGFDSHVHFLSPSQIHEALAAGLTTLAGGGTGPSEGSKATTVTPGAWHLKQAHRSLDDFPVNLLLLGKGNTVSAGAFAEQALAGAGGYKVHEDWGSTPAAIDAALKGAEEWGLQVALHSDSLNEAGFVASTIAAMAGRSISAFHVEGAGGGHAPDILTIAGLPHVLPGLDQSDAAAHRQHRRRAPRHADGLSSPEPGGAGGSGVRRVPDPGDDDRGRRSSARPRRHLDDLLRRPGDGPDRRGDHPDLAGRPRDEARSAVISAAGCRPTISGPGATWPSTRSIRRSRTASITRSVRSRSASWPTWCSGIRGSSAYAPRS